MNKFLEEIEFKLPKTHRQNFWCQQCDGVIVDSNNPDTGSFFAISGHVWQGTLSGGMSDQYSMTVFALCKNCIDLF